MIAFIDDYNATSPTIWVSHRNVTTVNDPFTIVLHGGSASTTTQISRAIRRINSILAAQQALHRALCAVLDAERQLRHAEPPDSEPRAAEMPWRVHRLRWGRTELRPRILP